MLLRLIVGRAGTGKTEHCLDSIRTELRRAPLGPQLILLVPDQATFQMERALLATTDLAGFIRVQVLSFSRLARRVVLQTGGVARPHLGELGRRMLLRAVLGQLEGELEVFGPLWRQPGFLEHLQRTLGELRAYAHTPDELRGVCDRLPEATATASDTAPGLPFAAKLRDLERVYRVYSRRLEQSYASPDQLMDWAAQRLWESPLWLGCRLWVDGFTGFTPQELRLLAALLRQAEQTEVTLCLDRRSGLGWAHGQPGDLFAPTERTADQLLRLAKQLRIQVAPPLDLNPPAGPPARFANSAALAAVERFWLPPERQAAAWAAEPAPVAATAAPPAPTTARAPAAASQAAVPGLSEDAYTPTVATDGRAALIWVEAASRRLEVEAAAQQIRLWVADEGWRWRDVAILAWSLEPYQSLLENALGQWGIPYFLDVRRSLTHHPAVELVRSALAVVARGWQTADVLQYVKTDLAGLSRDEQDRLEEWAYLHGIDGEAGWLTAVPGRSRRQPTAEAVASAATDGADLEEIRQRAVLPLLRLARRLPLGGQAVAPVRPFALALYQLWEELRLPVQLRSWMEQERQAGRLLAAEADRQVWQQLVQLLDELVNGLGDLPLTLAEFRQVVESGLSGLSLGLIPPSLDQVIVGTVERSRLPAVRGVLLLGAVAGEFPPVPQEDTLLGDAEREQLAQIGLELADDARLRLLHQPYALYVAATRASERLWASYPQTDGAGRSQAPAAWWLALREHFRLQPWVVRDEREILPVTLPALAGHWIERQRRGPDQPTEPPAMLGSPQDPLYRRLAADPVASAILSASQQTGEVPPLSRVTATALYGAEPRLTVSQLETVAACPFQQLATFGWRLREWEAPQVQPATFGQAVHQGLQAWVQEIQRRQAGTVAGQPPLPDWGQLTLEQSQEVLTGVLRGVTAQLERYLPLSGPLRYQEQVIARVLQVSLPALQAQIAASAFRPWRTEYAFAARWEWGEGQSLLLSGRIDRIDVAHGADGRWYVRVIDYKTGRVRPWRPAELSWGLALQLVVYLAVACELVATTEKLPAERVVPAGAFYFPVEDRRLPLTGTKLNELLEAAMRKGGPRSSVTGQKSGLDSDIWERRQRLWRLQGPVLCSSPAPGLHDLNLAAGKSGESQLVALAMTKAGLPRRGRPAQLDLAAMQGLLAGSRQKVAELAEQILCGQVSPRPYRRVEGVGGGRAGETACQYCPYGSICGFDVQLPAHHYRDLHQTE